MGLEGALCPCAAGDRYRRLARARGSATYERSGANTLGDSHPSVFGLAGGYLALIGFAKAWKATWGGPCVSAIRAMVRRFTDGEWRWWL